MSTNTSHQTIRVLLIYSHKIIRSGLKSTLDGFRVLDKRLEVVRDTLKDRERFFGHADEKRVLA